ncbi:CsgG/HfaB family protein [Spiribacter insolitus]|uniref:Curli production assembly/transport component CsgG n=1 Tax=Spiribacter insolitus TaxID=3122417 RepID=A0ABV3T6S1_9GAMM
MIVKRSLILSMGFVIVGCTTLDGDRPPDWATMERPGLASASTTYGDLLELPDPAGVIPAAVYGFRDLTGQYRESPSSNLSTAVTQGGGSLLTEALLRSGWFRPLEREGLQDLLTERRVARQLNTNVATLQDARVLFEGGVTGYDRNTTTGGFGARYFGLGASEAYVIDQVTVSLRAVNVSNGEVLAAVTTTKTIYSYQLEGGLFRFVRNQRLLEIEAGYTYNEPRYLATHDAINAALIHLIVRGLSEDHWRLANADDWNAPVIQTYNQAFLEHQETARQESPQSS